MSTAVQKYFVREGAYCYHLVLGIILTMSCSSILPLKQITMPCIKPMMLPMNSERVLFTGFRK